MKSKTVFVCQECGGQSPKWVGRCSDCGAWNSLVEERAQESGGAPPASHRYALSGAPSAYRYLSDTVGSYRTPNELRGMATAAGWSGVSYQALSAGTVGIVGGQRG